MELVRWSQPERRIPTDDVDDFYESPLGEPCLFHFTTSQLRLDPHGGAFSLKIVIDGAEDYLFARRRLRLRPGQLLFVPAGRRYGSEIGSRTESLSLFVPDAAAADLWRAGQDAHEALIDATPADVSPAPAPIAWRADGGAPDAVLSLRRALAAGTTEGARSAAHSLLLEAVRSWRRAAPLHALTGPRGAATRDELTARVMRARDQILDLEGVGCDLDRLATTACLSRYHFLRVFKEAFGCTPGRYAGWVRIECAQAALEAGTPAPQVARTFGYSRPGSLRRARRRMLAVTDS
jgi:AraC-like DNA-binding protein